MIQSVCKRIGIAAPVAANGSTDLIVQQILELSNEEGQELAARYQWTGLVKEASFTTVGVENQGALGTIAPGMKFIINDTIWNRSLRRPVFGPRTPPQWQQQKAININGPWNTFRIEGSNILFNPIPAVGHSCYFEFITGNWISLNAGGTGASWVNDADTSLLDEQLIALGTIWRWKAAKGLDYAEDFNKYEKRVLDAIGRDGTKDWLSTDGTKFDVFPGVVVPAGNWGT